MSDCMWPNPLGRNGRRGTGKHLALTGRLSHRHSGSTSPGRLGLLRFSHLVAGRLLRLWDDVGFFGLPAAGFSGLTPCFRSNSTITEIKHMSALHIGSFRAVVQDHAVVSSGTPEVRVPVTSRGFRTPDTARATTATDAAGAGSGVVLVGPARVSVIGSRRMVMAQNPYSDPPDAPPVPSVPLRDPPDGGTRSRRPWSRAAGARRRAGFRSR